MFEISRPGGGQGDGQIGSFDFEGHGVRVYGTENDPLFVAADVCGGLGLSNASEAVRPLGDDETAYIRIPDVSGRPRQTLVVTEPGLYALIARSRKPAAKRFDRWVRHEVLPSIRKTGAYAMNQRGGDGSIMDRLTTVLERMDSRQERIEFQLAKQDRDLDSIKEDNKRAKLRLDAIEASVAKFERRKKITSKTMRLHSKVVMLCYGGRCPCCGIRDVLGDGAKVIGEGDHWRSVSDNRPSSTWLICRNCNERLDREPAFKMLSKSAFEVFQTRRLAVSPDSRQGKLFGSDVA